jgi:hypothetical protein
MDFEFSGFFYNHNIQPFTEHVKITAQINEQGIALAEKYGIEFLAENFKKKNGFFISRKQGEELGVKHQGYCGCVYSKAERLLRRRQ